MEHDTGGCCCVLKWCASVEVVLLCVRGMVAGCTSAEVNVAERRCGEGWLGLRSTELSTVRAAKDEITSYFSPAEAASTTQQHNTTFKPANDRPLLATATSRAALPSSSPLHSMGIAPGDSRSTAGCSLGSLF